MGVTEVNQKSSALFPTPSTPHGTLANSQLLTSNHLACDWVTGGVNSNLRQGTEEVAELTLEWDEHCSLPYIFLYMYIYRNTPEKQQRTATSPTLSCSLLATVNHCGTALLRQAGRDNLHQHFVGHPAQRSPPSNPLQTRSVREKYKIGNSYS